MNERQLVRAALRDEDWRVLRALVAEWAPAKLPTLAEPPDTWTKQDVADFGLAIGQATIRDGLNDAGDVDDRGEALEALFSRLPQF